MRNQLRGATLAVALLAAAAPPAHAQQQLSLPEAAQLALRAHPTQEAAAAAIDRARAGEREARAARLPSLQLDGSAMQFAEPMVVAPLHGFDPQSPPRFDETLYQGFVSLSYTLFDGGARSARSGRARELSTAADAGALAARAALVAQVTNAYVRVLTARELVTAHEARLAAVRSERTRAALLFEQGRAARLVLLHAEAALAAAAADTVNAVAQRALAERVLGRLVGGEAEARTGGALVPLRDTLPEPPDRAGALQRALDQNPEVARARAQVNALEQTRREAGSAWFPRLQLVGRYAEYASSAGREQGEWQAGVQLGYPLFTGGARGAGRDRADAEVRTARAELRSVELRTADALDAAFSNWEAARARRVALADVLAQAQEVARIERLALDQGAGVQTDYLAAEAELFRTRAARTEARAAEVAARVELARVMGELDLEWLVANLERVR